MPEADAPLDPVAFTSASRWLGIDDFEVPGVFLPANSGVEDVVEFLTWPEIGLGTKVVSADACPPAFLELARRGLHVYRWSEHSDCYELLARPQVELDAGEALLRDPKWPARHLADGNHGFHRERLSSAHLAAKDPWPGKICAASDGRHLGASLSDGRLVFWQPDRSEPWRSFPRVAKVAEFAFEPASSLLFWSTWEGGLFCGSLETGELLWRRTDLVRIQHLALSPAFPESVFIAAGLEDGFETRHGPRLDGLWELSRKDGSPRWRADGDAIFAHPAEPLLLVVEGTDRRLRILDSRKRERSTMPSAEFPIVSVAFAEERFAVAEGDQGVRIFDFQGRLEAHYRPTGRATNCLQLAFGEDGLHVFDAWDGAFLTLLDPKSGAPRAEREIPGDRSLEFLERGTRFVDPEGGIFQTRTGERLGQLLLPPEPASAVHAK